MESESELNRLLIGIDDIILNWNRNWNLTTVSGIGIGIGIEGAGIVPSLTGRHNFDGNFITHLYEKRQSLNRGLQFWQDWTV